MQLFWASSGSWEGSGLLKARFRERGTWPVPRVQGLGGHTVLRVLWGLEKSHLSAEQASKVQRGHKCNKGWATPKSWGRKKLHLWQPVVHQTDPDAIQVTRSCANHVSRASPWSRGQRAAADGR